MSIRYGISVILQPAFTAQVHRARQTLCNQYGCWAAEMHPVHLPLIDYFLCSEEIVQSVDASLEQAAREAPGITLYQHSVVAAPDDAGNISLDFADGVPPTSQAGEAVNELRQWRDAVIEILEQVCGLSPYLEPHRETARENYRPRIALMQYASLPPRVFESAVTFAQAVVADLPVPERANPWQLVLIRFESDAAGEDWDDWNRGGWAADLRWQFIDSYPLH